MDMRFVENFPALVLDDKYLVIADLHFGSPNIFDLSTITFFIENDCRRLLSILRDKNFEALVIAGDVKDKLSARLPMSVKDEIVKCFTTILKEVNEVVIVVGNHDGGISNLFSGFDNIRVTEKFFLKEGEYAILIIHGHKKISVKSLSDINLLISAHIHPGFKVRLNNLSVIVKAWFVADLLLADKKEITWIIIPSFSSLISGIALNILSETEIKQLSPFRGDVEVLSRKFFLLDLTPIE